jgi:hypothetical protein
MSIEHCVPLAVLTLGEALVGEEAEATHDVPHRVAPRIEALRTRLVELSTATLPRCPRKAGERIARAVHGARFGLGGASL